MFGFVTANLKELTRDQQALFLKVLINARAGLAAELMAEVVFADEEALGKGIERKRLVIMQVNVVDDLGNDLAGIAFFRNGSA